jgi:hypothetical protein
MVEQKIGPMIKCLSPMLGLTCGFVLGCALHLVAPSDTVLTNIAITLFVLLMGIYCWAIAIVVGQKHKIHCGGTEPRDDDSEHYALWGMVGLLLLCLMLIFVVTNSMYFYFPLAFGFICGFIGELYWGNPLHPILP